MSELADKRSPCAESAAVGGEAAPSDMRRGDQSRSCPYFGRPQPSNMRSYNSDPLCMACAERLTFLGCGQWRHWSDPSAQEASA